MQKNKVIILLSILCLFCIFIVNNFDNKDSVVNISEYSNNQLKQNNTLALMYETTADSGEYIQSNDNVWPTGDYVYNEQLSKCEKGSKISYNESTKKVLVEANISDKCYVYFDIKPKVLFANYIKGLYTTNGVNNLYLHNSSLANSAEDGSIRYAGASETTNNFVCFGSDATTCENDNLYRIIGVFGDKVKLIKYDYATLTQLGNDGDYVEIYGTEPDDVVMYKGLLDINTEVGTYYWNKTNVSLSISEANKRNIWTYSELNKTNLNINYVNYLNHINPKWVNMIQDSNWYMSAPMSYNLNAKMMFDAIVENQYQTDSPSKIGLMYMSDYMYAASEKYWTYYAYTNNYSPDSNGNYGPEYDYRAATKDDWMYMGLYEWTITPALNISNAFYLGNDGLINSYMVQSYNVAIRPVFYLKPSVQYTSGNGSQSNPYRIQQM